MDVLKSAAFVTRRGSGLDRARLRWLLERVEPDSTIVDELALTQNEDGGFPFRTAPDSASTVGDTLNALWKLEDIGALTSAAGERAVRFIASAQRRDGGWDEDPGLVAYDPPPWRRPGDLASRMYLSASSLYYLALAGGEPSPSVVRACDYLLRHQTESGLLPGFAHSTWIGASALLLVGGLYEERAHRALEALSARPLNDWADSQIAWALSCFACAGLTQSNALVAGLIEELIERQRPDGSWASEDGESHDVDATIDAVKALGHYGLVHSGAEGHGGHVV